jgi:exodeoxyribonuclease-3
VGWRIDYFFVSKNLKKNVKAAFILPEVMGSDHCPVGVDLQI